MPTKREFAFGVGGIAIGVVAPRYIPKMKSIRAGRFWQEYFMAYDRLKKVCNEEYYRIEEAIENEMKFLEMIDPRNRYTNPLSYSFELVDDGEDRSVAWRIKTKEREMEE